LVTHRLPTPLCGLLICSIGVISCAGCTPMVVNREEDGKVVGRSIYEYGLLWPFPRQVDFPPPNEELRKEILAIVPLGTRRPEVLRRLKAAGMEGHFGVQMKEGGGHVPRHDCYCASSWRRPNGKVWFVDMQFFFDEERKLARITLSPDPRMRPDGTYRNDTEIAPTETIDKKSLRSRRENDSTEN
jgi:hypothetical protein